MTDPARSETSGAWIACVSLTVTAECVYTDIRCTRCQKQLYLSPGEIKIEVRIIPRANAASGRGRIVKCRRCTSLCEVIEHP